MAISPLEYIERVWVPKPVKGANQEFAKFLNRSWGLMENGTPLGVIRGLTENPERYDPLSHPDVYKMHSDFIQYSRFVESELTDPLHRTIILTVLDEVNTLGWPRETHTDSFLFNLGGLRRPLIHLGQMDLLHRNTALFLETAARRIDTP